MGAAFPENNSMADILMLAFGKIREKIEGKVWKITPEEMSLVDKIEFESLILDVKRNMDLVLRNFTGICRKGVYKKRNR